LSIEEIRSSGMSSSLTSRGWRGGNTDRINRRYKKQITAGGPRGLLDRAGTAVPRGSNMHCPVGFITTTVRL